MADLTDEELTLLSRLDGEPPCDTVTISRKVHEYALRAVAEIRRRRKEEQQNRAPNMATEYDGTDYG